ncbi:MlaD family protein [Patulibacter brassicae]|uniref:MlaD family protein n=1 Tax=Patulibacter brassicae TaxID=1705717 RepID=A0ABU4VN66_9ACTN|nr:MlaD family protein [Patulibacter brassicae]MDX8153291.1 MlaD family protein [Patulibacter brassicae]
MSRPSRTRRRAGLLLPVALLVVAVLAAFLVLRPDDDYVVHARFANAGQLVDGGLVEVGGVPIGKVASISIDDRGYADVALRIEDDRFVPLRQGTRATIRSVGQATLTNRYVELGTAPRSAAAIPDGGSLAVRDARGIVDLDAILSSVPPTMRRDLRALFANGAAMFAGSGAPAFNRTLRKLEPAMAQVDAVAAEVGSDQAQLERLVATAAAASSAVASRAPDLERAVRDSAITFGAISRQRAALAGALDHAPAVLRQAGGTLRRVAATVQELRPTLREVPVSETPLREFLRRTPRTVGALRGPLRETTALLPSVDRALREVPTLEPLIAKGLPALDAGTRKALPILEGVRFYGADFLLGVVNGLVTIATGQYNQQGHYLKVEFVQNPQTALGGTLASIIPSFSEALGGLVPGLFNAARKQNDRCPGGSAPPAPDGSSPWLPRQGLCDPTQSMSKLVNDPGALCQTSSVCTGDDRSKAFDLPARDDEEDGR